jgi:transposase
VRVSTAFNKMVLIPGAWVRSVRLSPEGMVVLVALRARRLRCPCGASTRSCYDRSVRRWRHLDAGGRRVFIEAEIRRLACPTCGSVRTEVVPWARPRARHTRAFEDVCTWLAQRSDRTTVARLQRCSWEAVSAIIERVVADHKPVLGELRRIGVDEISYAHTTFLTLVVDHDSGRVVWIGEGRSAESLAGFYRELGDAARSIEAVSCDLGEPYVAATRRHVPNARICFDPFHVVALANKALDQARTHARRLDPTARRRRHLRWALLKAEASLTAAQRAELDRLRRERNVLWRAWVLKEELRELFALDDPSLAATYLRTWLSRAARSRIPHMIDLARRLRAHFDGIIAAVELGLTNARLEGTNSKIRLINHRGYGHHSASSLAAMIHLCCGGLTLRLPFA